VSELSENLAPTQEVAAEPAAAEAVSDEPRIEAKPRRLNIIGRRNWFFLLSLIIIIPGIISMVSRGFLLGIDFAGGTEFTVTFENNPSIAQVESAVTSAIAGGSTLTATTSTPRSMISR